MLLYFIIKDMLFKDVSLEQTAYRDGHSINICFIHLENKITHKILRIYTLIYN